MTVELLTVLDIHNDQHIINPKMITSILFDGIHKNEYNGAPVAKFIVGGESFDLSFNYVHLLTERGYIKVTEPAEVPKDGEEEIKLEDTEYRDETVLEKESGIDIEVQNYDESYDDGHEEFGDYISEKIDSDVHLYNNEEGDKSEFGDDYVTLGRVNAQVEGSECLDKSLDEDIKERTCE